MSKLIKNSAILIVSLAILVFSLSYAYSKYLDTKKHNLDVINSIVKCTNDFGAEGSELCAKAIKREYIPKYVPIN